MTLQFVLAWWNLIFLVPFFLAVLYLGVYAVSGVTFGDDLAAEMDADADVDADFDADADIDADMHADIDADADLDADADADLHGDVHADADVDGEAEHELVASHAADGAAVLDAPLFWQALRWLGVGRVPVSVMLMILLLSWGAIGFAVNRLVADHLFWPALALVASVPSAGLGSLAITRVAARTLGKWMPMSETYVRTVDKLVGTSGHALLPIGTGFGMANVRDRHGDFFQVACRTYPDGPAIPKGERILLVDYEPQHKFYLVTRYDVDA
jgi:hypothetical protein